MNLASAASLSKRARTRPLNKIFFKCQLISIFKCQLISIIDFSIAIFLNILRLNYFVIATRL